MSQAVTPHAVAPDAISDAAPDAPPDAAMRECPDCGLFQRVPVMRPGLVAECGRCGAVLRRRRRDALGTTLAFSVTGVVLLMIAAASPLLGFQLAGQATQTSLSSLPGSFQEQGYGALAWVMIATTLLAPALKLGLTIAVLAGLRTNMAPSTLAAMARWRQTLTPWAMIEVFLLGVFVAYTRLASLAVVEVGVALYALGALMLVMIAADAWLDEHALWESIGQARRSPAPVGNGPLIGCDHCGRVSRAAPGDPCPRCNATLQTRKPESIARSWALLLAAAALYIPANLYPVMTVIRFGKGAPSTILHGVEELIQYRMWPLALLVFAASIAVPVLKLASLSYLLISTQRHATGRLRDRTRLYRIVDFIGRWSMIDVFMVAVLVALVRMGIIASVTPGLGAVFFAGVVVLTMLAAFSFDPRLMWDAAGQTGCDEAEAEA
ncbi:MAG: paraquat-inducible protein A [Gemmatimonadaceae bacterium]|nr:paraquat-inducible protein A [Acetobacteraceae bacterium]